MNKFKDSEYFLPMIILAMVFCLDCASFLFISGFKTPSLSLNIEPQSQMAALSVATQQRLRNIFGCVAPFFALTPANTESNPVIVPVVGSGICNPFLPANATSTDMGLIGGWDSAGYITGRDGKSYGTNGIVRGEWQNYDKDTRYPYGHYKFYFRDPSTTGSATPNGQLTVWVVYAPMLRFEIKSVSNSTSDLYDTSTTTSPVKLGTAGKNSLYLQYDRTPLINLMYKPFRAEQFNGTYYRASEKIYSSTGEVLYQNLATVDLAGNTITWNPTGAATPGQVYTVRICPANSNGTLVQKAICSSRVLILEDDLNIQ